MGGMGRVERLVLVRVMYCSSARLENKGGNHSNLLLNRCLGASGLILNLRDLESLSKSDNRFFMLGI